MCERISLPYENRKDGVSFLHQRSVRETYHLHCHDFYELFYIIKGKAIHNINGKNLVLSEGDFVLIRPDDIHKYEFLDNFDFEIVSIGISPQNFSDVLAMLEADPQCFTSNEMPPMINLHGHELSDIYHKLSRIDRIPIGKDRRLYFRAILPFMIYKFISGGEGQPRASIPGWLAELIEKMSVSDNFIAGLPKLLELSHLSQEHLTREFRRHLDLTPTEFINLKRLSFAAELISSGRQDMTEVCYACGFNNLSYFYSCFKKQYGCPPKKFSKNLPDT